MIYKTLTAKTIRLGARGYNPTIGRFDRTDPVIEGQEHLSLYQYGWNNPVLRSDPNGNCPDCPPNILADMYFTAKHAIENTALRLAGSDYRADYKVVGGEKVYATEFKKINVDNSIGGQLREAGNALVDIASIPMSAGGNPAGLLAKTGAKAEATTVAKEALEVTSRAARREAMRDAGIPTSQPLMADKATKSGDKVFLTRDGKSTVQNATNDVSHQGQPHWEAGPAKPNANAPDGLNRSGNNNKPQMGKPKSKVYYNE